MTLSVGDHVVKLDKEGKPLTTDKQVYIEYEVLGVTGAITKGDGTTEYGVVLRKVK